MRSGIMFARPCICLGLVIILFVGLGAGTKEEEIVEKWASQLGDELWKLGQQVTQFDSIAQIYGRMNTRVLPTNGEAILSSIVDTVSKLLKKKMDAVMCIIEAAERLGEEAETNVTRPISYNSAKCSDFIDLDTGNLTNSTLKSCDLWIEEERPSDLYNTITVTPDMHFSGISVNTNTSTVHMPTDIYDYAMPVQAALNWSAGLDETFQKNYKSDPSLKWQYFGSSTGFLRMYPATQWKKENDVYDCRKAPWFIEASTCSKDVVILFDRSGSMKGMSDSIAKLAISQILSTFSNNDFINIIGFNTTTFSMVPCFKENELVQATQENVRTFIDFVTEHQPTGKANFTTAFIQAFNLLGQYRETETCPDKTCNQAIMLITDSVAGNLTEVFEVYNWFENRTHIPVRVFTYLIGREVINVREIQWMACLNRGYYVHIQSHSEVRDKVLKYIPVIARPLVLQEVDHPLSWTHAFVDFKDPKLEGLLIETMGFEEQQDRLDKHNMAQETYYSKSRQDNSYILRFKKGPEDGGYEFVYCAGLEKTYFVDEFNIDPEMQEYQLMTSVSGPVFDHKVNRDNETQEAQLLGVAGSDLLIKDIEKLTLPYKIGANGYAFMITNNGYIMMHPDFRPVSEGKLRANYGSVDLTEVELLDDDNHNPRNYERNSTIMQLREQMINHTGGYISTMSNLQMKFHYDDMMRVGAESRNYYFSGIEGTPFTIGLALPTRYGNYWIKAGNIIKRSKLEGVPLTSYFKGNWKIHPDWVYCDHFITKESLTHEEKLLHFLEKIQNEKLGTLDGWKTKVQFPPDINYKSGKYGCNNNTVTEDEYFCDTELMQLLVFDAKSTESLYKKVVWEPENNDEKDIVKKYGVSVRFVATQSGLTRWQHMTELPEEELQFGEIFNKAIGEAWYRTAVLQHYIDENEMVFSVPFNSSEKEDLKVTASYAIFRNDGGNQAPGSVVGFHLSHSALFDRFKDVTSKTNCTNCMDPCTSDTTDCYIIDGNGYIVVSEKRHDTGTSFGNKEAAIMDDMTSKKIFRKIPMFDYQAVCFETDNNPSSANLLLTPFKLFHWLVKWFVTQMAWLIVETNWTNLNKVWATVLPREEADDEELDYTNIEGYAGGQVTTPAIPTIDNRTIESTRSCRSCDKFFNRYLLQSKNETIKQTKSKEDPCHRPYIVRRIPQTNLLLIVVKAMFSTCSKNATTDFVELEYLDADEPRIPSCLKMYLNDLPRRRLSGCYNEHPQELEIDRCGRGAELTLNILSFLPTVWITIRLIL